MTFFTTPELLELGDLPFVTPYAKPTREEALRYYRRVADTYRLASSLGERVESIEPRGRRLRACAPRVDAPGGRAARAARAAPGASSSPPATTTTRTRLGIPGEDLPHVSHYFDEPHPCHRRRVVVVGGSNSAAEAALALFRAGALVTLVHRRARLSGSIKYWVKPDIENRIAENAVAARFETAVVRDRAGLGPSSRGRRARGDPGRRGLPPHRLPPGRGAPRAGGRARRPANAPSRSTTPQTLETNVPGLFLAGAIVAGSDGNRVFIENGRFHGTTVVKAILARAEARA